MTKILSVVEVVEAIRQRHIHLKANNPVGFVHLFADIKKALTADRLALLQALHDELEGKKIKQNETETWDTELKTIVYGRRLEIHDQQDNLIKLIKELTK